MVQNCPAALQPEMGLLTCFMRKRMIMKGGCRKAQKKVGIKLLSIGLKIHQFLRLYVQA